MSDRVNAARDFAILAHGEQKYAGRTYAFHLDAVAELLKPFGKEAQIIGYLHDVAEDTAVGIEQIRAAFGDHVAACVKLVTDDPGANRRQRKEKTNAKLSKVGTENELALIVKAADRLANLRQSAGDETDSKLAMYRQEHAEFRRAAYRAGLCDSLWEEIERIIGGA